MSASKSLRERLQGVLAAQSAGTRVAGAVVGVAVGDEQVLLAHGSANLNTGQEFTTDTGWLLGSVTKVLTTTLLLRQVESGSIDLDAPVIRYLPEFAVRDADATTQITVRMLVNHTNGIDADSLMPTEVRGRDAARSYIAHLPRLGCVFEPGTGVHYSNPGFVLASRIIEEQTGLPFEHAIQRELFGPCGMNDATALQTQAFLRRTAIGAFPGAEPGALHATNMFTLPESIVGAGATPVVTVADMIAFGRMHLDGGVAPTGQRVISEELATAMQTPTYDGIPQAPPIGLGWWMFPIAGTTAPWHGGGSPGGTSSLCIVPEHDAVIVSFVSGPGGTQLNDVLHNTAIEHMTGRQVTPPLELDPTPPKGEVAGDYVSFQNRMTVRVEGDKLVLTRIFEPYDDEHRRFLANYTGSEETTTTVTYTGIAPGQFAVEGSDPQLLSGFYGRMDLLATLPSSSGRRAGLHSGLRFTPNAQLR